MNVMNTNNIDNRSNPSRDTPASKSSIKMGQGKISTINLKTAPRDGEQGSIEKAQIDVLGSAKVSPSGIKRSKIKRKRKSPLIPWKKPEGMPKRPLSAYNLFFQDRRKEIMESASESNELEDPKQSSRKQSKKKSGVGFANLARTIGTEWRALPSEKKAPYESRAAKDKGRYDKEMKVWRAKEKEMKEMRAAEQPSNAQPYDWSTLASITLSRKGYGDELPSLRKSVTDPALADLRVGMRPDRRQSTGMMPMQDRESRGSFHSSIYGNFNSNASWLETPSMQAANMMLQQQQQQLEQEALAYSSGGLSVLERRQLSSLNNPFRRDQVEQNLPLDVGSMGPSISAQGNQSLQYQNNPFPSKVNRSATKSLSWGNQRGALNMDNSMSTSLDLEPLPLPDNPQQREAIAQNARESQLDWSSQLGLQQMQQQRTTIASDEQYLRRLSTGVAPMFSSGWGQNNSLNMNALDANELVSTPYGGGSADQELQKLMMRSSQQTGTSLLAEELKSRSNDSRSFPSSPNDPNQDLYRFYDGQN